MILSAQSLRELKLVWPFVDRQVNQGMTYGCGPAGYDLRLAEDVWLWPGRFVLASALERFTMPDDVLGVVHDKSSWARRGVAVQNTVIEPGWCGFLTLELTMHAWRFMRLFKGTPICQVVFHKLDHPTDRPYGNGKYQNQPAGPQKAIYERT